MPGIWCVFFQQNDYDDLIGVFVLVVMTWSMLSRSWALGLQSAEEGQETANVSSSLLRTSPGSRDFRGRTRRPRLGGRTSNVQQKLVESEGWRKERELRRSEDTIQQKRWLRINILRLSGSTVIISAILQSAVGSPPPPPLRGLRRPAGRTGVRHTCVSSCVRLLVWDEVLIPAPQHAEVLAAVWMCLAGGKSQAWPPRVSFETQRSAVFNYEFTAGPLFNFSSTFQIQKKEGKKVQYSIISTDVFLL